MRLPRDLKGESELEGRTGKHIRAKTRKPTKKNKFFENKNFNKIITSDTGMMLASILKLDVRI